MPRAGTLADVTTGFNTPANCTRDGGNGNETFNYEGCIELRECFISCGWYIEIMLVILSVLILLAAPQLDPSLTPQPAPKPVLPKIDKNACPFEGCQFGAWTATDDVQLFSTWTEERKLVATISKGQQVTAITGVHITLAPSEVQVTTPIPNYSLKPGDIVYGYMYKGEGIFSAWFNGYWVEDFDGSSVAGAGCNRHCNAKLLREGRFEWWVQVKMKDGTTDWTKDADRFDGKDALSGTGQ